MIDLCARLEIQRLGQRGEGIANGPKGATYVPFALAGETVLAEVDGDRGRLVEVLAPSPQRIAACCQHFSICGGCAVQTLAPDAYAAWKHGLVLSSLRNSGLNIVLPPLIAAGGEGRRRATFHVRFNPNGTPQVGFMQARAHKIVEIQNCPILAPSMQGALPAARALAHALGDAPKPLDILLTATLAGLDADLRGSGPLSKVQRQKLIEIAVAQDLARLSNHGETLIETRLPQLKIGKALVKLPSGAFLQATEAGEAALAEQISKVTYHVKKIADLFAGIGTFSLRLAEQQEVHAYDLDEPALAALTAASHTPYLRPVATSVRDLFRHPLIPEELAKFDAVLFDPPRAGAEAQARALAHSKVPLVIAISCNVQTFSRDAAILHGGGYVLESVEVIDQFLYSPHVEMIGVFQKPMMKAKRAKRLLG